MGVWPFVAAVFSISLAYGQDPRPIHFVFDMDDTLIRWVRPEESGVGHIVPSKGDIGGYRYRILDGAPELLESLLRDFPNAKISFYSAGPRERNLQVLEGLRLPDGRSARQIATHILSKGDIDELESSDQHGKPLTTDFSGRQKKNLLRVVEEPSELSQVILIDDKLGHAAPGQEKSLLWIGNKPGLHVSELSRDGSTRSGQVREFLTDRNKLARVRGLIESAAELSRSERIPITQALWRLQWSADRNGRPAYRVETFRDVALYRRGAQLLRQVNPAYRFISAFPAVESLECLRRLLAAPAR